MAVGVEPAIGTVNELRVALLTKTYGPDLANLQVMLHSLRRVGSEMRHVVLVNDDDYFSMADALKGFDLEVLPDSAVMPEGHRRARRIHEYLSTAVGDEPGRVASRLLAKGTRVAIGSLDGWWSQQIAKLSASISEPDCVFVHADSDLYFLEAPTEDWALDGGVPVLYSRPAPSLKEVEWKLRAHRLFELDRYADAPTTFTVLPQVIDGRTVQRLVQEVERRSSMPWWLTMLRRRVTEYELYGTYAAHVDPVGVKQRDAAGSLEISSWHPDTGLSRLRAAAEGLEPLPRVAWVQSKAPAASREAALEILERL